MPVQGEAATNNEGYAMNTSEVLHKAADAIQRRGWTKASGWHPAPGSTEPVCLEGALRCALPDGIMHGTPAFVAVVDYLTTTRPDFINPVTGKVIPFSWNDAQKSAGPVIEVLRAAAAVEAAREDATVAEQVSA